MKFFYIKAKYKNVEQMYWLNNTSASEAMPLTKEKVAAEFIALAFYRLMGIPTPKTYLGQSHEGAVLISKQKKNWQSLRFNENKEETPELPKDLECLAELELASALLSDIDVSGWVFDNLGKKQRGKNTIVTKHDGGTQVLSVEKLKFYLNFFELRQEEKAFPLGISTLSDTNSLEHTYLKVFLVDNVTHYNQRYKHLFDSIAVEQRKKALRKLFHINMQDLQLLFAKIPEDWLPQSKKIEMIDFLTQRIETFKIKYQNQLDLKEMPSQPIQLSANHFFQKLLQQNRVLREDWEQRFVIDESFCDLGDWSQSSAGQNRFIKESRIKKI